MKFLSKRLWLTGFFFLLPIALLFFPHLAFAQDFPSASSNVADCTPFPMCLWLNALRFTPPPTDVSVMLLSHIFGKVGEVLYGPQPTILGNIFGMFNNAMGGIIGLLVVFTTTRAIFDTARDGTPLGKKLSGFTVMRTVAGLSIVVPTATGYSIIQIIVMWVALQGVGFADSVWNGTLIYLQKGNPFYTTVIKTTTDTGLGAEDILISPATITGSLSESNPVEDAANPNTGASGVLRSLVCMHEMENTLNNDYRAQKANDIDPQMGTLTKGSIAYENASAIANTTFILDPSYDNANYVAYFPGTTKSDNVGDLDLAQYKGVCGTYRWGWDQGTDTDKVYLQDKTAYIPTKYSGLLAMVSALDPIAKDIADKVLYNDTDQEISDQEKTDQIANDQTSVATNIVNNAVNYQAALYTIRKAAGANKDYKPPKIVKGGQQLDQDTINLATQQGWATAGRYYHFIAKARSAIEQSIEKNHFLLTAQSDENSPIKLIQPPFSNKDNTIISNSQKLKDFFTDGPGKNNNLDFTTALNNITDATKKAVEMSDEMNSNLTESGIQDIDKTKGILKKFVKSVREMKPEDLYTPLMVVQEGVIQKKVKGVPLIKKKSFKLFGRKLPKKTIWFIKPKPRRVIRKPKNVDPGLMVAGPALKTVGIVFSDWYNIMVRNCLKHVGSVSKACPAASPIPQPIEKLKSLGDSMMRNVIQAFLDTMIAIRSLFTSLFIAQGVVGGVSMILGAIPGFALGQVLWNVFMSIVQTLLMYVIISVGILTPIVLAILGPMFMLGITLNIYVPLIPYLLFTFGVISWLIFVIEAMAAAPLVALGITHPEGHDFLGKSTQGLMILFSVFLRPVSMIIGLISAMVLSYVAIDLVNITFSGIMHDLGFLGEHAKSVTGAASKVLGRTGLTEGEYYTTFATLTPKSIVITLKFMFYMIIYTYIMLTLVNQTFALIYVIPEKIGRWIGLHPEAVGAKELLQTVQGGIKEWGGVTQKIGEGAVSGVSGKIGFKPEMLKQEQFKGKSTATLGADDSSGGAVGGGGGAGVGGGGGGGTSGVAGGGKKK